MWIMVAGPYRSGSNDPQVWQANWRELNRAAYELWRMGHVSIIGVNMALPVIKAVGENTYEEVMMPLSLEITKRCDAVLRIGGSSSGADREVNRFTARNLPVYRNIEEIPSA